MAKSKSGINMLEYNCIWDVSVVCSFLMRAVQCKGAMLVAKQLTNCFLNRETIDESLCNVIKGTDIYFTLTFEQKLNTYIFNASMLLDPLTPNLFPIV